MHVLKVSSLLFIAGLICIPCIEAATNWPIPDWETIDNSIKMQSKQCQNFKKFATQSKNFKTDGLIVIKDGLIEFEFYDHKNSRTKPHVLWSVSKTITGALLGIAQEEGRINLDQFLFEFYPGKNQSEAYNKITINNLLYFDTGLMWHEAIKDVEVNDVVAMLYGRGHQDMALYAATREMSREGPGNKWNYSSGTPTITMGVLKKIYGDEYNQMPWRNLFNRLGINNSVFEQDPSGSFVGGSGWFASLRDLAKIGYLYLNNGVWNGEVVLPSDWIKKMLTPSPGYISPGTIITDITDDGVFGGSIWLNRKIKKGFGKPYPYSPENMYMAVGLGGQLIIMLPSQNMLIVRTGYDKTFNPKVDELVSRALSCFYDPKYPIGKEIPRLYPEHMSILKLIKNVKNAIEAHTLEASIAKTICSCHFVSKMDIPACLKRNHFPLTKFLTKIKIKKEMALDGTISFQVHLARFARLFKFHLGHSAKATYDPLHPELGCTLK